MDLDLLSSCDICGDGHPTEQCPELGLDHISLELDQLSTRARLTLPHYLEVVDTGDRQVTVVAKETIARKTQMGPYEAKRTTHIFDDAGYFTLKLLAPDGTNVCLDTTDENECNWLCLVQAATTTQQHNCIAYQLGPNIFYNTIRDIQPREELRVWYAPNFARKLGKPTEPDNISRVLLGHRIEPLHHELLIEETVPAAYDAAFESESVVNEQTSTDVHSTKGVSVHSAPSLPQGEIIKGFYCPRCGHTFATQPEMVHHLRVHIKAGIAASKVNQRRPGRPRKHPITESTTHNGVKKRGKRRPRNGVIMYSKTISKKRKRHSGKDSSDLDDPDPGTYDDLDPGDDPDHEYSPQKTCTVTPGRSNPRRSTRGKHSKFDSDYVYTAIVKAEPDEDLESLDDDADNNEKDGAFTIENKTSSLKTYSRRGRGRPRKVRSDDQMLSGPAVKAPATDSPVQESADALDSTSNTGENSALGDKTVIVVNLEEFRKSNGKNGNVFSTFVQSSRTSDTSNSNRFSDDVSKDCQSDHLNFQDNNDVDKVHELMYQENVNVADDLKDAGLNTQNELDKNSLEIIDTKGEFNNDEPNGTGHKDILIEQATDLGDENSTKQHYSGDKVRSMIEKCETVTSSNHTESVGESHENNLTIVHDSQHVAAINQLAEQSVNENGLSQDGSEAVVSTSTEVTVVDANVNTVSTADNESQVTMYEETDENVFTCVLCDETFSTDIGAIEHFVSHNEDDKGACKYCGTEFPSIREVLGHRKDCKVLAVKYVCDICQQAFKSAHYLYRHMVMHTDTFVCRKCKKTFSRKDSLQKHVLKCCPEFASDYRIHYCEVCHRVFSTGPGLNRHKEKCKSVGCNTCNKIFASRDDLNIHKCHHTAYKDESARYSCGQCSKCFQSMYYLQQHRLMHKSLHSCDKCGRNLANKDDLETHRMLCDTLESIRLFGCGKCGQCDLEFNNGKAFREHHQSHTHQYQCDKCMKRFIKIGTLTNHECQGAATDFLCPACKRCFKNSETLEKHTSEAECMNYACSACGKQFHLKSQGKDHLVSCTGVFPENAPSPLIKIREKSFICQQCGKSFSTKSNLTKHILLHGEKLYKCPYCEKAFHLDVYLKEHLSGVHLNNYKYQCNDCGRMMKSKTGFTEHVRVFHTKNAEMYTCPECNKQFKQRGNLRSHMFSHSEERKFACEICLKSFKYPDQLSRHKLEHKSTVKFSCILCSKNFLRSTELKKHIELYHSGLVYVCGVCNARCGHRHTLVRHYKRKHPDQVSLLAKEGYISSLHKHVSTVYDANEQKLVEIDGDNVNSGEHIVVDGASLPREAAEALHNLALGTATQKHYDILKEKGLILQGPAQGTLSESNVIVPQDSYILPVQDQITGILDHEGTISISAEQLETSLGVRQNPDGSFTMNGISVLPQALEGPDGQIVILQIVDPESQEPQQSVLQQLQTQMGSIQLAQRESLVSATNNADKEQVLTTEETDMKQDNVSSSDGIEQVEIVGDVIDTATEGEVVQDSHVTVSSNQADNSTDVIENEVTE